MDVVAADSTRGGLILLNWGYKLFWTSAGNWTQVLWTAASALDHWTTSPAHIGFCFCCCLWDKASLCSSGCPVTFSADQVFPWTHRDPASTSTRCCHHDWLLCHYLIDLKIRCILLSYVWGCFGCVCLCGVWVPGVRRGQKRAPDAELPSGWWVSNLGPVVECLVFLTTKPFLSPHVYSFCLFC